MAKLDKFTSNYGLWHSHHIMTVTPSGTDNSTMHSMAEDMPLFVTIIINNKLEINARAASITTINTQETISLVDDDGNKLTDVVNSEDKKLIVRDLKYVKPELTFEFPELQKRIDELEENRKENLKTTHTYPTLGEYIRNNNHNNHKGQYNRGTYNKEANEFICDMLRPFTLPGNMSTYASLYIGSLSKKIDKTKNGQLSTLQTQIEDKVIRLIIGDMDEPITRWAELTDTQKEFDDFMDDVKAEIDRQRVLFNNNKNANLKDTYAFLNKIIGNVASLIVFNEN